MIAASGEVMGSESLPLGAGGRLSALVDELVSDSEGQAGGYVSIESDQPIIAQLLFGATGPNGISLFSAVPPTVIE